MGENRGGNYDADDSFINVMNVDGTYRKILVGHGTDLRIHIERSRNSEGKVDIVEQCVVITLDVTNNWQYWTQEGSQKGNLGCLFSASLIPKNIKS